MEPIIRPAHGSDTGRLYEICLKTGDSGKDATGCFSDPYLLGNYYAVPYLIHSPSHCFVAGSSGLAEGYVVGTSHTERFNRWMEESWLPALRRSYPRQHEQWTARQNSLVETLHRPPTVDPRLRGFPAHMHIDLLPVLQGKGVGRRLVERFLESMAEQHVPAVHLGVGTRNANAIRFYVHIGFEELFKSADALYMGIKT